MLYISYVYNYYVVCTLQWTAVTDGVVQYKSEYKSLWSKKLMLKIFPFPPPITYYEYQFCFHDMHFTFSNVFQ
jgi:hypothetical protein